MREGTERREQRGGGTEVRAVEGGDGGEGTEGRGKDIKGSRH